MDQPGNKDLIGRLRIERTSTAERVADGLRDLVISGDIQPGSPLREGDMVDALDVSRNTIREAFRLLGREGLVVHQMHRGVVVKRLYERDVRDIYATRATLERAAVARCVTAGDDELARIGEVVEHARAAETVEDWKTVATLDLLFHQRIVELLGSERVNAFFRGILTELRLAFAGMHDHQELLSPFVSWNEKLAGRLAARDAAGSDNELAKYLKEAERVITASLRAAEQGATGESARLGSRP